MPPFAFISLSSQNPNPINLNMENRIKSDQSHTAIVVGSGIAGLLSAHVLSKYFYQVILLERDQLPDGPHFRQGVPQGFYGHALVTGGHRILERFFPGLDNELARLGGQAGDAQEDGLYYFRKGWLPQFESKLRSRASSRVQLEWLILKRVRTLENVNILEGHRVTDLIYDKETNNVVGVHVKDGSEKDSMVKTLLADLVVDASGRTSHAESWLHSLGFTRPEQTVVRSGLRYASRRYIQTKEKRNWHLIAIVGPAHNPRNGAIYPEEHHRWVVCLSGIGNELQANDNEGFEAFARKLESPLVYEAFRDAQPISNVQCFRATENRWRHYESMPHFPQRFIVIGDAACSFNPLFAQGMSVSAIAAATLEKCLESHQRRQGLDDLTGFAKCFQKRLSRDFRTPWVLATSEDQRHAEAGNSRLNWPMALMYWYADRVLECALVNRQVCQASQEVVQMVSPLSSLAKPRIFLRVIWHGLKRRYGLQTPLPVTDVKEEMACD